MLLRKGQHEGLVSLATWKCVQERLTETPKAPFRKDIATDFPLRGFVRCADCCRPMTAAWSKGSTRSYPYYLCDTRGCVSYRKSIRRDLIEDGFAEIARTLPPSRNLLSIVRTVFRDLWETRLARTLLDEKHLKQRLDEIDTQSEAFLERIVATTAVPLISPYEKKIASLAEERPLLTEKLEHVAPTPERFEQMFKLAWILLSSPWKIWRSDVLRLQRLVLRLAFATPLAFDRKIGCRTPDLVLPFKVLLGSKAPKREMVRLRDAALT